MYHRQHEVAICVRSRLPRTFDTQRAGLDMRNAEPRQGQGVCAKFELVVASLDFKVPDTPVEHVAVGGQPLTRRVTPTPVWLWQNSRRPPLQLRQCPQVT